VGRILSGFIDYFSKEKGEGSFAPPFSFCPALKNGDVTLLI